MNIAVFMLFALIFIVMVICAGMIFAETIRQLRNPIPKMHNHDKRFLEIKNEYLHEMYSVKSR